MFDSCRPNGLMGFVAQYDNSTAYFDQRNKLSLTVPLLRTDRRIPMSSFMSSASHAFVTTVVI